MSHVPPYDYTTFDSPSTPNEWDSPFEPVDTLVGHFNAMATSPSKELQDDALNMMVSWRTFPEPKADIVDKAIYQMRSHLQVDARASAEQAARIEDLVLFFKDTEIQKVENSRTLVKIMKGMIDWLEDHEFEELARLFREKVIREWAIGAYTHVWEVG